MFFEPLDFNTLAEQILDIQLKETIDTPNNYLLNIEESKKELVKLFSNFG